MNKIKIFFYGIIAACGALFVELIFKSFSENYQQSVSLENFSFILIAFIIIEEFFKFLLIYKISLENKESNKLFFYSLIFGLGFSLLEISIIIFIGQLYENPILGLLGIFFLHILTCGIFGHFLSKEGQRISLATKSLILSLFLHIIYNALIIYNFGYEIALIFLFFSYLFLFSIRKLKK